MDDFLRSRKDGISWNTIRDYRDVLTKALPILGLTPKTAQINSYIHSLKCSPGGKFRYYRNIRAFFNWLYSLRSGYEYTPEDNPVTWLEAPARPVRILPSLTQEEVYRLIEEADSVRNKAIISLLAESGLRLSELTDIMLRDINWNDRTIRTIGKGNKEAYAPFGKLSEQYLREWFMEYQPNDGNIWGMNNWGIASMLRRLEEKTGLPCNPHTFRRTFTCLLRKAGVDTMTIKDLGRWESLEMVQRYTRAVTFHDSL